MTTDALERSYVRAFRQLGYEVIPWNMPATIGRNTRGGRAGAYVSQFWPVEAWIAKASRELLLSVLDARPELVAVVGSTRVLTGALAQIRASLPNCKLVMIWPDTLLNCYSHSINSIPVYDLVATYSRDSVDVFRRLGARQAEWVPLAFDPELHNPALGTGDRKGIYADCDATFVGNHSPERERLIVHLISCGFRIKVWGPVAWKRFAKDRNAFQRYWQGNELHPDDYCYAMQAAPVSLNPISPLNYPAANMRFFEILGVGGTPLSGACPEMESEFPDRQACFYYRNEKDAPDVLSGLLGNRASRELVSKTGQERVRRAHTYVHRAKQILTILSA
jgi:hypothetical protein